MPRPNPPNTTPQAQPHIHLLDLWRGLGALAVIVYHWGSQLDIRFGVEASALPFYRPLRIFYRQGSLAVDLFFCLSGYIFFLLYSRSIAEGRVSIRKFFALRFSRLYPLHLATLLVMALIGICARFLPRPPGDFSNQNVYNFVVHLLLLSGLGFERGYAYNQPVWSISVEAFLYAAFFLLVRLRRFGPATCATLASIGYFVLCGLQAQQIGSGLLFFFLGGLVFWSHESMRDRAALPRWFTFGCAAAIAAGLVIRHYEAGMRIYALAGSPGFAFMGVNLTQGLLAGVSETIPIALAAYYLILVTVTIQARRPELGARLDGFGQISYGLYLLHIPTSAALYVLFLYLGLDLKFMTSSWFFLFYLATVIGLASLVYRWFEDPARDYLRLLLIGRGSSMK